MNAPRLPRTCRAAIFDLDGLLLDSERVYSIAANELLKPFGQTFSWEVKAKMMGQPARDATQTLLDETSIPLDLEDAMQRLRTVQDEYFQKVQPLPGAIRLLAHFQRHDVPMAIATGSQLRNLKLKTAHLPDLLAFFPDPQLIVTADDPDLAPGRGKPHPDIFEIAAHRLGITASDALVFEDGLPGVEAAVRAGMQSSDVGEADMGATVILQSLNDFVPESFGWPPF